MKFVWISTALLSSFFFLSVPISGDTYHYRVIRKICPVGTYHDPIRDRCRAVPGGGEMIKINLDARCSGGFEGLLANSRRSRYYYVCGKDSVLTCMCKANELFSKIRLRCENKDGKGETFTHEVVENIFDKYKCAMMGESYENRGREMSENESSDDQNESSDRENIAKLQNLLRYLQVMRTIDSSMKSYEESLEATTTTTKAPPAIFLIPISNEITTKVPKTTVRSNLLPQFDQLEEYYRTRLTTTNRPVTMRDFDSSEEVTEATTEKAAQTTTEVPAETTTEEVIETTTDVETTTDFEVIENVTDRSVQSERALKARTKKKHHKTTTEMNDYYEYYYDDEPDKILWIEDVRKAKNFPPTTEEIEAPESLISTKSEGSFEVSTVESAGEITTTIQPEVTTTIQPEATTQIETTAAMRAFDDSTQSTTELPETTTLIDDFDTTTLDAPDALIMTTFNDENLQFYPREFESTTEAETTSTQQSETTTDSDFVSTTLGYESTTIAYESTTILIEPESTTATEIDSTTFDYDRSFDSTTEIESTTLDSTTEISTQTTDDPFDQETTTDFISTTTQQITTTEDSILTTTDVIASRSFELDSTTIEGSTTTEDYSTTIPPETTQWLEETSTIQTTETSTQEETTTEIQSTTAAVERSDTTDFTTLETTTDFTTVPTTWNSVNGLRETTDELPIDINTAVNERSKKKKKKRVKRIRISENGSEVEYSTEVSEELESSNRTGNHFVSLEFNGGLFSSSTSTSAKPQKPLIKQDQKKREEIEYYYSYEEYEVDAHGNPIEHGGGERIETNERSNEKKRQRDNSYEYYGSVSASEEMRKSDPDYFNYFY